MDCRISTETLRKPPLQYPSVIPYLPSIIPDLPSVIPDLLSVIPYLLSVIPEKSGIQESGGAGTSPFPQY